MFFFLSKTLDVLLSPLSWALLVLIAGVTRKRLHVPTWSPLTALAILVFFSLEPVSNSLVRRTESSATRTDRPAIQYDAVILLGGLVEDRPTQWTGMTNYNEHAERLLATYDVLRTEHAKQVIISSGGTSPDDPLVEARLLAAQLTKWGVDPARLLVEDKSRNTRENALFSKQIVDQRHLKRLLLVTSAAHMPRALDCFHRVGLDADALPVDYHSYDPALNTGSFMPRADKLSDSVDALRELVGRLIYRLVGYGSG